VDLSNTFLTSIGSASFRRCALVNVVLPATLTSVGDNFLPKYQGRALDLSGTRLRAVGRKFLADSSIQRLRLPTTLTKVPGDFLSGFSATVLDLSSSGIESIGPLFGTQFRDVSCLILPSSLKVVGNGFLRGFFGLTRLDLPSTCLETIGDGSLRENFLRQASNGMIRFDDHLLDLSLLLVGDSFLDSTSSEVIGLPQTLKVIAQEFLANVRLVRRIDLSHTFIERVVDLFLAHSAVEEPILPPTSAAVGSRTLMRNENANKDNPEQSQQGKTALCKSTRPESQRLSRAFAPNQNKEKKNQPHQDFCFPPRCSCPWSSPFAF
jgi:hypothetical protein